MNAHDDFGFSIDLTVRNEWRNIDLLRTSVQNCFIAVFADLDGCHALAMVTGELLENALKYGDWASGDRAMFRLRVIGREGNIEVSVQNPLREDDPNAATLMESIAWINSFAKPEQAYRARMLQIAQDDSDATPSRLGLARIAFEGNCKLDAKLGANMVTVSATVQPEEA
jgi:two-component sensor histidine kinase